MIGYMIEQETRQPAAVRGAVRDAADDGRGRPRRSRLRRIRPSSSGRSTTRPEADRLAPRRAGCSSRTATSGAASCRRRCRSGSSRSGRSRWLLEHGTIVICAGGGGIPTMYEQGANRKLVGVEAVIDKDLCSELLARELDADLFVMLTDADAVYVDWGKPTQKAIRSSSPLSLGRHRVRRRVDGAEGGGRLSLRGRYRQPRRDRRARGSEPDHRRRGRHDRCPQGHGDGFSRLRPMGRRGSRRRVARLLSGRSACLRRLLLGGRVAGRGVRQERRMCTGAAPVMMPAPSLERCRHSMLSVARAAGAARPAARPPAVCFCLPCFSSRCRCQAGRMVTIFEPRSYSNIPVGMNFLVMGINYQIGDVATDPALPLDDAEVDVWIEAFGRPSPDTLPGGVDTGSRRRFTSAGRSGRALAHGHRAPRVDRARPHHAQLPLGRGSNSAAQRGCRRVRSRPRPASPVHEREAQAGARREHP